MGGWGGVGWGERSGYGRVWRWGGGDRRGGTQDEKTCSKPWCIIIFAFIQHIMSIAKYPKRKHACILRGSTNETRISRIQESASVSMGGIPWWGGDERRFEDSGPGAVFGAAWGVVRKKDLEPLDASYWTPQECQCGVLESYIEGEGSRGE